MKTKLHGFLTLFIVLLVQISFAQERVITGVVSDNSGLPIPGVNILVKGTKQGTQTDFDGKFSIKATPTQTLIFNFVGMKSQEIAASSSTINVKMKDDAVELESVVVTALGVSREKKSLGYATQEVKGESIAAIKSNNFVNALSGKVSGVQVKRTTNFGGSTNVVIRGNASLTGNNQALFVIDGVPVSNNNSNSRSQEQTGNGFDYGNAASDINPEDIESVNVLKGSAASALYGSRAANGVIMITTKKGSKKANGYSVTLNSGITVGSVDKSTFVKYQNEYGGGYGPYYGPNGTYLDQIDINGDGNLDYVTPLTEDASYGQAFDPNLLVYQWGAFYPESPTYLQATPWVNAKNGPITFFETPYTYNNSISIDNALEKGYLRLGISNLQQTGLLPNSSLKRNTVTLNGSNLINERLTIAGSGNFTNTNTIGRNSTGYNDNITGNFRQWWQTNVDIKELQSAYQNTGRNVTWNPNSYTNPTPIFWDNPYFQRYENYESDQRTRFIGNASLDYKVNSWLDVYGRLSVDTYDELQEERRAVGSVPTRFGIGTGGGDGSINRNDVGSGYSRKNISFSEYNYDLMLNFNKDFSQKVNLKGVAGINIRRSKYKSIWAATNGGISIPGLYSLQNTTNPALSPIERDESIGVNGIYASASLGYDKFLFLDATVRRDESSTLPSNNNSFIYPSVSTSFIFSEFVKPSWLSFGKVRLNYAEVGNSPGFDRILDTYAVNTAFGAASASVKDTKNNPNLRPEKTRSYEAGLEVMMFKKRLGFDLSIYSSSSVDQIIPLRVTSATGYLYQLINAGEILNKGVELSLNGKPVKSNNFSWDVNLNWSKNKSEVVSLLDGIETLQLGSFQGGITINAQVGQPYGVIYGSDYTYLNGQRVINASNGQYIKTDTSDNVIGNANPNWIAGLNNKFNYKNLSLEFLIDIQHGGDIFSLDRYYGLATGLYDDTVFTNDLGNPVRNSLANGGGFINTGVNPDGSVNDTRIRADRYGAFGYRRGLPDRAFVYDASYVKLRQASLSYSFSDKMLKNTFINGATLSLIGSNLWIIHKNLPDADPESGLGSGNLQGYSTGSLPSTRDISFNLKLQF